MLFRREKLRMGFIINDSIKIVDLQEAFTKMFPYLKLELFRKGNNSGNGSSEIKQPILSKDKTLAELSTIAKDQQVVVSPQTTVSELEKHIREIFGLSLQVFRKSGNVWLMTSFTDSWTLEEQNHQGELITEQMNSRKSRAS